MISFCHVTKFASQGHVTFVVCPAYRDWNYVVKVYLRTQFLTAVPTDPAKLSSSGEFDYFSLFISSFYANCAIGVWFRHHVSVAR